MVVEPVEVAAVLTFPGEVCRARIFHAATIGIAPVLRRAPAPAPIAAVTLDRVAIDGAINDMDRAVAQHAVALFLGDKAARRGGNQAGVALGQGFPKKFFRVWFRE